jgi:hypothetical protein
VPASLCRISPLGLAVLACLASCAVDEAETETRRARAGPASRSAEQLGADWEYLEAVAHDWFEDFLEITMLRSDVFRRTLFVVIEGKGASLYASALGHLLGLPPLRQLELEHAEYQQVFFTTWDLVEELDARRINVSIAKDVAGERAAIAADVLIRTRLPVRFQLRRGGSSRFVSAFEYDHCAPERPLVACARPVVEIWPEHVTVELWRGYRGPCSVPHPPHDEDVIPDFSSPQVVAANRYVCHSLLRGASPEDDESDGRQLDAEHVAELVRRAVQRAPGCSYATLVGTGDVPWADVANTAAGLLDSGFVLVLGFSVDRPPMSCENEPIDRTPRPVGVLQQDLSKLGRLRASVVLVQDLPPDPGVVHGPGTESVAR